MLEKVKLAIPVTTDAYDTELQSLINAAKLDLSETAGIVLPDPLDALAERAIITYCKMHFLSVSDKEYDRICAAYEKQKAQLMCANRYIGGAAS